MKTKITELSFDELKQVLAGYGQPEYRARQVFKWLYLKLAAKFDEMTDLPAGLRQRLAAETILLRLHQIDEVSTEDGRTVKVLFELEDKKSVESVLMMAEEAGEERKRNTVCVSSQVGCTTHCPFCATGQQGFERNLTPGEIIEQVLYFQRQLAASRYAPVTAGITPNYLTNIVFMGMGEPLANYESVRKAVETLISKEGMGFGMRRITISTCGLVPEIKRLADESFHVELAISLHAPNNALRDRLVPINKEYPIEMLVAAVDYYFEKTGRRPTFEYILFRGLNDTLENARELAHLLRGKNCHVNLIPASPTLSPKFAPTPIEQIRAFQEELTRLGISNTLRMSKGLEIQAACGQLRSKR
ncbi:MAG: 23S rRNA (adenine(2503)-C(2))-methyltransferase RlmN [Dehalococcoidales bacterium]|nr:23S rRNA (adenine(2503)-C(2))-methyltransferase RlmN [Dehalococcoidales bacterium]